MIYALAVFILAGVFHAHLKVEYIKIYALKC